MSLFATADTGVTRTESPRHPGAPCRPALGDTASKLGADKVQFVRSTHSKGVSASLVTSTSRPFTDSFMALPQLLRLFGQYDTAESIDKELAGSLRLAVA
ncbi:MAG: hypothetical protein CM15mP25_6140 [Gammaproteobacteria bacterium]|nr:MAG: hypothetical protein CM15mP25_6140 [Gammaproteobacteria bacterium]